MSIYQRAAAARDLHLLARGAAGEPGAVAAALRYRPRPPALDPLLQLWILPSRVAAIAAVVLGFAALVLASVGIYGVVG